MIFRETIRRLFGQAETTTVRPPAEEGGAKMRLLPGAGYVSVTPAEALRWSREHEPNYLAALKEEREALAVERSRRAVQAANWQSHHVRTRHRLG